jgi:hypothetical protein
MMRSTGRPAVICGVLTIAALSRIPSLTAFAATALSYATTWSDSDGKQKQVTFRGSAEGSTLSGTLNVDALELHVSGVLVGNSVTGTLRSQTGEPMASFSGKRDAAGMFRGTVTVGSTVWEWSVPADAVPSLEQ